MNQSTWIDAGPRGSQTTIGGIDASGPTLRVLDSKGALKFEVAPSSRAGYRLIRDWAEANLKEAAK